MPSTAHHGTLAVMPFLGHNSWLIGHGLSSDKLAASMEPVSPTLIAIPFSDSSGQ